MDETKNLLTEEINTLFEKLKTLDAASDEYKKVTDRIETLHKLMMDEVKTDAAHQEHLDRHELERDKHFLDSQSQDDDRRLKEAQYKLQKGIQIATIAVSVGTVIAKIISNHVAHTRGLKFEIDNSIFSKHNGIFFNKLTENFKD